MHKIERFLAKSHYLVGVDAISPRVDILLAKGRNLGQDDKIMQKHVRDFGFSSADPPASGLVLSPTYPHLVLAALRILALVIVL